MEHMLDRMNNLVNDLLLLTRMDSDTVVLSVDDENIKINLKDIAYITPYIEF